MNGRKVQWCLFSCLWMLFIGVAGARAANILSVETIAALRTTTAQDKQAAYVAGYWTAGDGGGGLFYRDDGSTATIDDGIIVNCIQGGRWIRNADASEPINVRWYGAKGDGTTNDTAAIQAAASRAVAVTKILFFPAGSYKVTSSISLTLGIRVCGENWWNTEIISYTNNPILSFTGDRDLVLEHLTFRQVDPAYTAARALYASLANTKLTVKIRFCRFRYFLGGAVYIDRPLYLTITDTIFDGPHIGIPGFPTVQTASAITLNNGSLLTVTNSHFNYWKHAVNATNCIQAVVDKNEIYANTVGIYSRSTSSGLAGNWYLEDNLYRYNYDPSHGGGYFNDLNDPNNASKSTRAVEYGYNNCLLNAAADSTQGRYVTKH